LLRLDISMRPRIYLGWSFEIMKSFTPNGKNEAGKFKNCKDFNGLS
jgi:hypothetical protein